MVRAPGVHAYLYFLFLNHVSIENTEETEILTVLGSSSLSE